MLLNPYLCLCGDKELLLIIFSLFLSPVAASGNTVIVQLLCEHKCHVSLKDSVRMSVIRDSLTAGKMVFLSFSACVLLHLRAACGLPQTCALSSTTPQRLFSVGLNLCSAALIKIPMAHLRSLLQRDCLSRVVF